MLLKRFTGIYISVLLLLSHTAFTQVAENYFKDTITRSYNGLSGSLKENDQFLYFWGSGIGKYSMRTPMIHKIDTAGNELWNTGKSSLLGFDGHIINTVMDTRFLYAFGLRTSGTYGFFMAKIDKSNGNVIFEKDEHPVNAEGILDARDVGADSLRIVCYTYDGGQGVYNITPINAYTISKITGMSAAPRPYGISSMAPLYIDANDIAYYYTATDSLVKYNTISKTVLWRNKTVLPGLFFARPITHVVKEPGYVYVFGDRFSHAINDNTGQTIWNILLPSNSLQEFWPTNVVIRDDTIYASWSHPYSGSVTEYGHFSKVNKRTGAVYLNGTIMNNGPINYSGEGYFRNAAFSVNAKGEIFMLGHYYTYPGHRSIKKFSSTGALLNEFRLPADTIPYRQFNVVPGYHREMRAAYLFHDQPYFLYQNNITNGQHASLSAAYVQVSSAGSVTKKTTYDHNYYQFPSTVVDIQKTGGSTYVLKKQGAGCFVEKFQANYTLIWRKELSSCFFNPHSFAIDSSENICVVGATSNCEPSMVERPITSHSGINRLIFLDKNGAILNDRNVPYFTVDQPAQLLGAEKEFYLVNTSKYFKLDPVNGAAAGVSYGAANFSSSIWNGNSNKIFLQVNTKDSLYIFSSRLSGSTDALCIAVNKTNGSRRTVSLSSSFPNGYLLHAVKSLSDSNTAYVSGLTGVGSLPVIIKYNLKTRTVIWKYTGPRMGEGFKVVEEPGGNLYAMVRVIDSTKIIKLNSVSGQVIWQYAKFETDRSAMCIDIDVSPSNKIVVAAGSTLTGNVYKPYMVTLNIDNGALINLTTLTGDAGELNLIQAVESLPGSAMLVGGNLNAAALDGRNGFIFINGTLTACNVRASFRAVRDANYPARFQFTNLSTADAGTLFKWNFGNGDSAVTRDVSYTFTSPGTYKITLTAWRDGYCSNTMDTTISVTAAEICPVTAAFIFTTDSVNAGRVIFTNLSTAPAGINYSWSFGDGSPADTSRSPVHNFKASGTFSICMEAELNSNCIRRYCDSVTIQLPGTRLLTYPNPAPGSITLRLIAESASTYTITIINFSGFVVRQFQVPVQAGINNINISLSGLPTGIYFIEAANNVEKLRTTFLKL